ncbi:MAG: hypothetical protein LBT66_03110 [Methanobrevibacter sp.]|jgi:septation ring formation regulator EzrA|nr:hypothetical protein [Candidatus Methanovirga meridionalis]
MNDSDYKYFDEQFSRVDEKFNRVDEQFSRVDEKFNNMENDIKDIKNDIEDIRFNHLTHIEKYICILKDREGKISINKNSKNLIIPIVSVLVAIIGLLWGRI